jgi:hypothetical protein
MLALGILGAVWVLLCGAFYVVMRQPPERFGRIIAGIPGPLRIVMAALPFESLWNLARGGDLEVGDIAPDFCLAPVGDEGASECVRLSSFRGRQPVVLVFGSYT